MSNTDALLAQLKAGGYLLVQEKGENWLMFSTRQPGAMQKVTEANIKFGQSFILIGGMDQLYEYVLRFSELAWDIAAETEKRLLIWYNHAKDVAPAFKDQDGNVGLMINRSKNLDPLLHKLGHGLGCLQITGNEQACEALGNKLTLLDQTAGTRVAPERIMRLSAEGDVKFLKY